MKPQIAILICIIIIICLFLRGRKACPMPSWASWIVLLWIVIIGSRPVSIWFSGGLQIEKVEDYLDGSPFDRNIFICLIVIGLMGLVRNRVRVGKLVSSNRWVLAFSLYCGVSVLWSDFPYVAFKRLAKDLGSLVMVLIIFSENDPAAAIKAILSRCAYVLIPMSVILIKYFPDLGRYYNPWTWEYAYSGITTSKNELGIVLFVCGLFLIWDLIDAHTWGEKKAYVDFWIRIGLLLMLFWLMDMAKSATSLICLIIGTVILLVLRLSFAKRKVKNLGIYILMACFIVFSIYFIPGIMDWFVGLLGRDKTLTGRTDMWFDLLSEPINPILGAGFKSFWLGPGAERMWAKYYFHPVQAHNGYLETYLNGGIVGVVLLLAIILSAGNNLKKELLLGSSLGTFKVPVLIGTLVYNWTEATFNTMSLIWFIFLVSIINYMGLLKSNSLQSQGNCALDQVHSGY
jgi:exopolysaccharide production protein ExoQ